ncbi:hypothetical protein PG997_000087 [Apiospora hydei]|uniref:Uncharacterized protein n=1 Tax=Apiospora hydei TaxID=1337664 RepID=A0ABR1X9S1_9PEZI
METGTARRSSETAPGGRGVESGRYYYEQQHDDDTSEDSLHLPRQVPDDKYVAGPESPGLSRSSGSWQHVALEEPPSSPQSPGVRRWRGVCRKRGRLARFHLSISSKRTRGNCKGLI